uniref:Uncharacterized protein n=1 Tax=Gasterosteus aculeatus aculeatus TaxID=481459 RepID=A0AAQ4QVW9_GASAC
MATSLRSTTSGFPSVSVEANTWRKAHFTAAKAHTPGKCFCEFTGGD